MKTPNIDISKEKISHFCQHWYIAKLSLLGSVLCRVTPKSLNRQIYDRLQDPYWIRAIDQSEEAIRWMNQQLKVLDINLLKN